VGFLLLKSGERSVEGKIEKERTPIAKDATSISLWFVQHRRRTGERTNARSRGGRFRGGGETLPDLGSKP